MKKSLLSISAIFAAALLLTACESSSHKMSSAQMAELSGQTTGTDMQGNVVELPTHFTYGGDNTAAYNGGNIATGVKDPGICGSFGENKCSVSHLK